MKTRAFSSCLAVAVVFSSFACSHAQSTSNASMSAAARQGQWQSLFDGQTMSEWRGYKSETVPDGWKVVGGIITKETSTGDIVTRRQFDNFELELDWKLGVGGNAGIFYRGTEEYDHIYWSAPEYQLLDDATAPDGHNRLTSAGAAYALYPPPAGVLHPAGQWNTARIIVRGNHVEHWMNGQKLLEYELGSPAWQARVQASKFKDWPNYGKAARGYLAIQGDHDGTLSLRNIRIRELK